MQWNHLNFQNNQQLKDYLIFTFQSTSKCFLVKFIAIMEFLKFLSFSVVLLIFVSAEEKVSYRNAKFVEFEVKNEKQFDVVKTLEFDSRVRWNFIEILFNLNLIIL